MCCQQYRQRLVRFRMYCHIGVPLLFWDEWLRRLVPIPQTSRDRPRVITELTLDELSYHAVYRVSLLEGVTFEVVVNISLNRKHILLASGLARVLPVPLPRLGVFRFHGNPLPRPSAVRIRVVKKNVTR